jgi:hypothetical protein
MDIDSACPRSSEGSEAVEQAEMKESRANYNLRARKEISNDEMKESESNDSCEDSKSRLRSLDGPYVPKASSSGSLKQPSVRPCVTRVHVNEIKYNLFYSIDADKINDIDEVLRVKALCLRWFAFKFKDTDAKAQILRHTEGIVES